VRVPVLEWVIREFFYPGNPGYAVCYGGLIIFFSFFYTAITFNPVEIADNMKKYGGVIVGVRPGKATAEYLNHVMTRITLAGSIFLAVIALLPEGVYYFIKVPDWTIVQFFGGTSLLILVGVALDTVKQIEQHLLMRHYDGFGGKTGRIRSRRTF
jgi:preprotein translocase subunit SecY